MDDTLDDIIKQLSEKIQKKKIFQDEFFCENSEHLDPCLY
jgi:hypothetical protein